MKKLVSLMLAVAMLLTLAASFAEETATQTITLYVTGMSTDGENWLDPSAMGLNMTFELSDDMTYKVMMDGEESGSGTFETTEDGHFILDMDGEKLEFAINENEEFIGGMEGEWIKLSYFPGAGIELPATLTANDIADFNGNYNATIIDAFGMTMDMAALAGTGELEALLGDLGDLSLVIDNGTVAIFGQDPDTFDFADGILIKDLGLGEDASSFNQTITLTETGVFYTVMGMNIYFDRAE